MGEVAKWNNHRFVVSSRLVRAISEISIKGSFESKETVSDNQKFVRRENGKPVELSFTVTLSAALGCDVRKESVDFVNEATNGAKDYFYIGRKKLMPCAFMLTDASVEDVEITPKGKWAYASVKLTMKQSTKSDGTMPIAPAGGGGGRRNKYTKKPDKPMFTNSHGGKYTALIYHER